jgi:superfamily II DNA or RNA helicase
MGVDWDVRCIILARPTKSEMKFVQIIGRGLRRTPINGL